MFSGEQNMKNNQAKKMELSAHNIYLELNFKSQTLNNRKVRKTFGHLEAKQKYQHNHNSKNALQLRNDDGKEKSLKTQPKS